MQKTRTFGSSSGDMGMTSEGADFLALIWRLLSLSLERLLLFSPKGNTLEAKDGGFNRFWVLSRADPEVGHNGVLWMDREATTWAIVRKREKWGGRGRRECEGYKKKVRGEMEVGKIAAKFGGGSEKEALFVSKHKGQYCVWILFNVFVVVILLKWTVLLFCFFFFSQ